MDIWKSLAGIAEVTLTSASPAQMLTAMNNSGIRFLGTRYMNEMNVHVTIYRCDYRKMRQIAEKRGELCKITRLRGIYWVLRGLLKRPILITGMALIFFLAIYLPSRVLFVCVEGNETVPTKLIVEKAEACGIRFGASRRLVRSERIKNNLLDAIPQLQWAGINTYGCVAVIGVNERQEVSNDIEHNYEIASVVAARDGVIQELTVYNGNPACRVGQVVEKGQLLVSSYTDCGIYIKAVRAEADVLAKTQRALNAVAMFPSTQRGAQIGSSRNYSLQIGKKLINLYKGSGISCTSCVKIRTQSYITLPGGFQIPVAFVEERVDHFEYLHALDQDEHGTQWMINFAEEYLQSQMIAGQIISSDVSVDTTSNLIVLQGEYNCQEMIGRLQNEEIVQENGKSG